MIESELKLIRFGLRHWLLLIAAACVGAILGYIIAIQNGRQHEAITELFVRFGNEYTVPSALPGSDRQQVDIDFDIAMNGEIQIITSWSAVLSALEQLPHPELGSDAEAVAKQVSASHVENSPVLVVRVVDEDRDWALRFLERLIQAYNVRRLALFERVDDKAFLQERIEQLSSDLIDTRSEMKRLRQEVLEGPVVDVNGEVASGSGGIEPKISAIDLLVSREAALVGLLADMQGQELKVDILSGTIGDVEVLSEPRLSQNLVGLSIRAMMAVMAVVLVLTTAALLLLREILKK